MGDPSVPGLAAAWGALPHAHGPAPAQGRLRVLLSDFRVEEDLGVEPDGAGEHLWVRIRKTERTTEEVARWLATALEVPKRAVSWAGLKDRNALTEQWFGVHMPGRQVAATDWPEPPAGVAVLEWHRNSRKLRTGMLRGNHFRLVLRDLQGGGAALDQRLATIARAGVPNYFGPQRFGRDGRNLEAAWRLLGGQRVRDRHQRGLFISAARSFLFNRVLAERVQAGSWARPLPDDRMTFSTSASLFPAADLRPGDPRCAIGTIHPTGPLPGRGPAAEADGDDPEARVLDQWPGIVAGLARLGVDQARRALRLSVAELAWHRGDAETLVLAFWLPAGAYATSVLRECVDVEEGAAPGQPERRERSST